MDLEVIGEQSDNVLLSRFWEGGRGIGTPMAGGGEGLDCKVGFDAGSSTIVLPSPEILMAGEPSSEDPSDADRRARRLEMVFERHLLPATVAEVRTGPRFTLYGVRLGAGVEGRRLVALADDVALAMGVASVRVVAMPGRDLVGLELPDHTQRRISLRELILSTSFAASAVTLPVILGSMSTGEPAVVDLAAIHHLFVAGATGSGKSVGLDTVLLSLLYRQAPRYCRFIMIDLQGLGLAPYDGIPHLLSPVVRDTNVAMRALRWLLGQMDDRYRRMVSLGVRNLAGLNERAEALLALKALGGRDKSDLDDVQSAVPDGTERSTAEAGLPAIIVVIDELADLVAAQEDDGAELAAALHRLADRGPAAGVHMLLSSSVWPSGHLDDLVGTSAAGRVSYGQADAHDEAVFFGVGPTVQARSKGDLLFKPPGREIALVHGPLVVEQEVRAVTDHWREQAEPDYDPKMWEDLRDDGRVDVVTCADTPGEEQYRNAVQLVLESRRASTSWLQRQLRVGYNVSATLIERMESDGLVGRPDHVGRREVLRDIDGSPLPRNADVATGLG